jgi:hypothetical protein
MSNLKEVLAQDFIFLHGDKKYSKEHQFIACERSRNETHVIVGYAYRWFSDAKTTISQYAIPISDWEDTEKFITFNNYVKENLITIVSVKEVNGIAQVVYYCKERRRIYRKSFADTVREFRDAYRKANKK